MRPPAGDPEYSAQVWLEYADIDLRAGEKLAGDAEVALVVCFHAQQAAEKALKAYLCHIGVAQVPKTHDLEHLVGLAVSQGAEPPPLEGLLPLNEYAVRARYPGPDRPTISQAERALRWGREIVEFVREALLKASPEQDDDGGSHTPPHSQ